MDRRTASSTVPNDPITGLLKQVPGYWVFNAMARYPITEHLDFQANLYNLANKYFYDEIASRTYRARGRAARRYWDSTLNSDREKETRHVLLPIPDLLNAEQVAQARKMLDDADWVDGRATAGHQSARTKNNQQLPEDSSTAQKLGEMILNALGQNPTFVAAALPLKVFPPLFNRYQGGESFGTHIDNAIRQVTGTAHRIRTDLSATLFFSRARGIRRR